ncbi:MAG TPA: hypothetical protein VFI46_17830 [Jiangellaceae bacterium]|nr:hypothetical protein [Jiangellaceae bacterium]
MGYSGLIYAAIVAAWAAVLVPRWVRRNEEVEHVREADAARGVRVLPRVVDAPRARRRVTEVPFVATATAAHAQTTHSALAAAEPVGDIGREAAFGGSGSGIAARRRRRTLVVLALALGVVAAAVVAGRLPNWALAVPAVMLAVFLVLARRAAVVEARRRITVRRNGGFAAESEPPPPVAKRIAVLDEPEPLPEVDPNAWEPVPVPLPTYVTKAVAVPPAARTIDLSQPGAWTSGRLDPAGSIALQGTRTAAEQLDDDVAELAEHRPAVGD